MIDSLAWLLLGAAAVGVTALSIMCVLTWLHVRVAPPPPKAAPPQGISVLKPLCGLDDDLERNLERFATMKDPHYELLLGVRDALDAAYSVALAAAKKWPSLVRVVLQQGEPGLNPKVNQLVTLARGEVRNPRGARCLSRGCFKRATNAPRTVGIHPGASTRSKLEGGERTT